MESAFELKSRIAVLDGLRALAIILVLARHSVRVFWQDLSQPFLPVGSLDVGSLLINGWVGVDLFFVLSGFLITAHLLKRHFENSIRPANLPHYFKRRFFRIAPAYYFVLLAVCIGIFPFFPFPENYDNIGWRFLYHLLFLQDYFPPDINVVFWSLAIEIKFYFLAPFIIWGLLYLQRIELRLLILGFLLFVQPVARWITAVYGFEPFGDYISYFFNIRNIFHLCLDGLLVGMACAFIVSHERYFVFIKKPAVANALFYVSLIIFLIITLRRPLVDTGVGWFEITIMATLVSLCFGGMMLGLLGECRGRKIFEQPTLRFIALISYSLYLVHYPLMFVSYEIIHKFINPGMAIQIAYVFYLPVFLVLCFTLSSLMYVFIERPFIIFSRKGGGVPE